MNDTGIALNEKLLKFKTLHTLVPPTDFNSSDEETICLTVLPNLVLTHAA